MLSVGRTDMTEADKFSAGWEKLFLFAGNIVFVIVFGILAVTGDRVHRNAANWQLLLINLLVLAVLCAGSFYMPRKALPKCKHPVAMLLGIYVLLFVLQCIFVHYTYFYTGWDVDLVKWKVEGVLEGHSLQDLGADDYFSICPNNLMLFYAQYLLSKIGKMFSLEIPYNLCIYASCFCVAASCFFGSLVVRKTTRNRMVRCMYGLVSTAFILFCPWIAIPYSDTYGMLFVSLGIWAVYCLEKPVLKWPVLAFAALFGYHIKPTCIFPLFAAVILYLPRFISKWKQRWKELGILALSCLIVWGAGQGMVSWIQYSLSFRLDHEQELPPNHYIMMGMNMDTKGGFSPDDREFAVNIPTYEAKKQLIWDEIGVRWGQMTPEQKREHYLTKLIYIVNNGTFSWGDEGIFFYSIPEHDNFLNDIYREIFYPEGKYFTLYCELAQLVWMQILLGIVLLFIDKKNKVFHKAFLIIMLCGLLVFLMLFEARARYLILYSPAFLILSLYGYEGLFSRLSAKISRNPQSVA